MITLAWLLLCLLRGWQVETAFKDLAPYLYVPMFIIAGGWLGRRARERFSPAAIGWAVVAAVTFVALSAFLTEHHGRGTTGYANANAALAVQLMAMAGLVSLGRRTRRLGLLGLVVGVAAIAANGSQGGAATAAIAIGGVVAAQALPLTSSRWVPATLSLGAYAVATATMLWLARRPTWPDWLVNALTSTRQDMWHAAWHAFRHAVFFGYGPGGYAWVNPWSFQSETLSAHSVTAQVIAELGGVGLALLALLFLSGLAWAVSSPSVNGAWVAAAAWTALAVHSQMDHLLEYWPVPLAAGLVLGLAHKSEASPEGEEKAV